ncbi:hypothetical protein JCM21900_006407 [Sporobolomyces salmonicolor]
MAPSSTSAASSASSSINGDADSPVYPTKLATSLAGLPVRVPGQQDGTEASRAAKGDKAGLGDTLDLATNPQTPSDIAAKLEQKRLEHEKQRELQKRAFEEQVSPAVLGSQGEAGQAT